jgi:hypothetical protein
MDKCRVFENEGNDAEAVCSFKVIETFGECKRGDAVGVGCANETQLAVSRRPAAMAKRENFEIADSMFTLKLNQTPLLAAEISSVFSASISDVQGVRGIGA